MQQTFQEKTNSPACLKEIVLNFLLQKYHIVHRGGFPYGV